MAKSQQTYNKIEKEKKRAKKREEKQKKKEERRNNPKGGNSEFAYVDQFGNLTDTPPDPNDKIEVNAEDIVIGIPKKEPGEEEDDPFKKIKEGKVSFFDHSKGFGFILEEGTQEKYFVHISGTLDKIEENDQVIFELERGPKGMNAVQVRKK
ncbi:MAG TPA: cold shock domain-containing protein [Flavobacteriaceae bacterium]|nr:cold shock domain-containing protein [Flavobacteriaceae bacterium]